MRADILDGWDPDLVGDPRKVEPVGTPAAAEPAPPSATPETSAPPVAAEQPAVPTQGGARHDAVARSEAVVAPDAGASPVAAAAPAPVAATLMAAAPVASAASVAQPSAAPAAPAPPAELVPAPVMPTLAEAFATLLAAEQSRRILPSSLAARSVSDETVDEIVRRVIARMGEQAVKDTVVDVAERLVREEIDRIKSSAPRA
jgi:hypothetical protein